MMIIRVMVTVMIMRMVMVIAMTFFFMSLMVMIDKNMSDDDETSPKRAKFSFHSTPKGKQINVQKPKGSIMRAVSNPSGHRHYVHVDHLAYLLRHKVDDPYQKGTRLALSCVE